jgi:hypothetical protein
MRKVLQIQYSQWLIVLTAMLIFILLPSVNTGESVQGTLPVCTPIPAGLTCISTKYLLAKLYDETGQSKIGGMAYSIPPALNII